MRVSEVIREEMKEDTISDVCVLSGPSHAEEVAKRAPTTVSTASRKPQSQEIVQDVFMNKRLNIYRNDDMTNVSKSAVRLKASLHLPSASCTVLILQDNAKAANHHPGASKNREARHTDGCKTAHIPGSHRYGRFDCDRHKHAFEELPVRHHAC